MKKSYRSDGSETVRARAACRMAALAASTVLALQGCAFGGISRDIADDGKAAAQILFPVMEHDGARRRQGSFPQREKLRAVHPGLHKDQVYALLGAPHYREGIAGVREWDYLFEFPSGGSVTPCQYKLLFDRDDKTGSAHWWPAQCAVFLQ